LIKRILPANLFFENNPKNIKEWKEDSWTTFFVEKLNLNFDRANLVWNHETRVELRESLESEITFIKDARIKNEEGVVWNFEDFEIEYKSLQKLFPVGGYFLL
jgi:hypothetical protein